MLGAAAGFTAGYVAWRACEALADRSQPAASRERDAQRYGALRRKLVLAGIARSLASLGILTFAIADPAERALEALPRPLRLPLFALTVVAFDTLRDWPVDYVEEYVLERVYGNSDRTSAAWAADRVKALGVTLAVTGVLVPLLDLVFRRAPRRWPLIAIGATPLLLAFANVIAPTFVLPLFNAYVPLGGELEPRIRALASRYGAGDATILRFDMSRQTRKANAFVIGIFGTKRIALADTLVEEFAPDETLFVVAHELGHYVRRDPWLAIVLGTASLSVTLFFALAANGRRTPSGPTGSTRLAFYLSLGQLAMMPLLNAFSRAIERRADRFALAATGDADAGIRAFRRLRDQNLAEDEGPKWAELLFSSHPSLKSRIAALSS